MKGIVTLCGSTKFKEFYNYCSYHFTLNDYAILSVGAFMHSDNDPEIKHEIYNHKKLIDRLHKEKISLSRFIFVIDVNGYVGNSTKSEIAYAKKLGIPVFYFSRNDHHMFFKTSSLKTLLPKSNGVSG